MIIRRTFLATVAVFCSPAFGQFMLLGVSLEGLPSPPFGFVYLLGADGDYLLGTDGDYLLGVA